MSGTLFKLSIFPAALCFLFACSPDAEAEISQAERTFWQSVQNSGDPDELEAYLRAYPNGEFAGAAQVRLKELQDTPVANSIALVAEEKPPLKGEDVGFLGLSVQSVKQGELSKYGLVEPRGAKVSVDPKYGPATRAGFKAGDLILRIDDQFINNHAHMVSITRSKRPGDLLKIARRRNGIDEVVEFQIGALGRDTFEAASSGNAAAMELLARFLYAGDVFQKDIARSIKWYERACELGLPKACSSLGLHYQSWLPTEKRDVVTAGKWFRKGAELDDVRSMQQLANVLAFAAGHPRDYPGAIKWYRRAIEKGNDVASLANLALVYEGKNGAPKDLKEFFRLTKLAAEAGRPEAIINLGVAYANGVGVKRDVAMAVRHLTIAGNKGHPVAWRYLGEWYKRGNPVSKDRSKAIQYYRKAAAIGDALAKNELKKLGASPEDPAEIQRLLAALGYDPGPIDGKIGKNARSAIRAFEKDQGLQVLGNPTFELQSKLAAAHKKMLIQKARAVAKPDEGALALEKLD